MGELTAVNMPRFFIFGDSHAGTLMRSARSLDLDFAGGSVMAGMYLNDPFFKVRGGRFVMTTDESAARLQKRLTDAGLGRNLLDVDMPILSTVGFNTTNFSNAFLTTELAILDSPGTRLISMACFRAVVEASRQGALEFYRVLAQEKKTVFAVLSPQRFSQDNFTISRAFEDAMIGMITKLGVKIIDVRAETTGSDGILLPQFANPDDGVHGNDAFGAVVLRRFAEMLASNQEQSA